ncbi:alpha/beta hydrolase [Sphingomonas sp. CJ20]
MRRIALAAALALGACHAAPEQAAMGNAGMISAAPVTLTAADGVKIAGVVTRPEKPRAMILLFHQADSGKDEYALIAPRLAQVGYATLRIDQRAGGAMFGGNETVKALGKAASYLDAQKDVEAALDWAGLQKLPVLLWGSSYSASLALIVAAERRDAVKGVLAFSPGEYFDDKGLVARSAAKVTAPLFVTSAQDGREIDAARAVVAASPAQDKTQFVPKTGGIHGSSTLLREKNPDGAEPAWKAVLAFLSRVTGG